MSCKIFRVAESNLGHSAGNSISIRGDRGLGGDVLTTGIKVSHEIDVEICQLVRERIFNAVWNWTKQQGQFGTMEY